MERNPDLLTPLRAAEQLEQIAQDLAITKEDTAAFVLACAKVLRECSHELDELYMKYEFPKDLEEGYGDR